MPSLLNRISRSLLPAMLLAVSGCAGQDAISPPVPDLQAVTESKPVPGNDIAISQKAADDYSASVEAWGDRISAAGGRICRWATSVYKTGVRCPKEIN